MLDWPLRFSARRHREGVALAVGAPLDLLWTATELNEWALCDALVDHDPDAWSGLQHQLVLAAAEAEELSPELLALPPVLEKGAAMSRLRALVTRDCDSRLRELQAEANTRQVPKMFVEGALTLGQGRAGRTWESGALPTIAEVPWSDLGPIPTALVSGSNGKTTTVRLIAACATAAGRVTGHSCTDGVFIGGLPVATGDYSGPRGARTVLEDPRVQTAILETARGGLLRRGLAVERADVVVITQVSADHLGEYGIFDVEALADVKWVLVGALGNHGLLVLPAADPILSARGLEAAVPVGWFDADWEHPVLVGARGRGAANCGARDGRLRLDWEGEVEDLGPIAAMPITVLGTARHNVVNLAGAALAARGLGIQATTIRAVFARFGDRPEDNPGRLNRWERNGVQIVMDYAHNPEGIAALAPVVGPLRGAGRLIVLLGQAGNRTDADIVRLAHAVADLLPDVVIVKELVSFLRGRPEGEVPALLLETLLARGLPLDQVPVVQGEQEAAELALRHAKPGDVVLLLVHTEAGREAVRGLLDR